MYKTSHNFIVPHHIDTKRHPKANTYQKANSRVACVCVCVCSLFSRVHSRSFIISAISTSCRRASDHQSTDQTHDERHDRGGRNASADGPVRTAAAARGGRGVGLREEVGAVWSDELLAVYARDPENDAVRPAEPSLFEAEAMVRVSIHKRGTEKK